MPKWKLIRIVAIVSLIVVAMLAATYVLGRRNGMSTSRFEGAITLSNADHTEGCVRPAKGREVCGAFVNETGGDNAQFVNGAKVTGRLGKLALPGTDRRIIFLKVSPF